MENQGNNILEIVKKNFYDEKQKEINLEDCTLLITSFNRGKILSEDLINGLKFGMQNKVIIDDLSSEELEYLEYITKSKNKLCIENVIRQNVNRGVAECRSIALRSITTHNTIILDDDDILLSINKDELGKEYEKLGKDAVIIIPRYMVNLYNNIIAIGYDRKDYNELEAKYVLKDISVTSEIRGLLAGSISKTKELLEYNPGSSFVTAEDFMTLIRLFANNLNKRVVVSENYVHVRRMSINSLSKNISNKKLALTLIAQCVGCYYCIKNYMFNITDAYNYMEKRGKLLQEIYQYGRQFVMDLISYLNSEVKEDIFIKYLNKLDIVCENSIDEVCKEINLMKKLIQISTLK